MCFPEMAFKNVAGLMQESTFLQLILSEFSQRLRERSQYPWNEPERLFVADGDLIVFGPNCFFRQAGPPGEFSKINSVLRSSVSQLTGMHRANELMARLNVDGGGEVPEPGRAPDA